MFFVRFCFYVPALIPEFSVAPVRECLSVNCSWGTCDNRAPSSGALFFSWQRKASKMQTCSVVLEPLKTR